MATTRRPPPGTPPQRAPKQADTFEGREQQVVGHAVKLAEKQLLDGTASAQVIVHYLKLGSTRNVLEHQKLTRENELLAARVEALASAKNIEELYESALNAMSSYKGVDDDEEYYDD